MKPTILVGGQAVIEGVMMRVPGAYATAVRDPNGKIHFEKKKYSCDFRFTTPRICFSKISIHVKLFNQCLIFEPKFTHSVIAFLNVREPYWKISGRHCNTVGRENTTLFLGTD